jgi:pyridoxal 5'-phosphate synthase pdxT subunit
MKIGVLALQGAFIEHVQILRALGITATEVRRQGDLEGLDGLIIPGGESTTMLKLARHYHLLEPLRRMAASGKAIMGTCAGMILLAGRVVDSDMATLGLMDIDVRRNAFGRQVDSFEADIPIPCLGPGPFHAVFIRAPCIEATGPKAEVLARLNDGSAVAVRQGNLLALAFHPELSHDLRMHQYFINMVRENQNRS